MYLEHTTMNFIAWTKVFILCTLKFIYIVLGHIVVSFSHKIFCIFYIVVDQCHMKLTPLMSLKCKNPSRYDLCKNPSPSLMYRL